MEVKDIVEVLIHSSSRPLTGKDIKYSINSDKSIDVVYIGTVNQAHKDNILLCLKNNKSVLCEKPITLNSNELEEIITYKKNKNIFLMEAMRTRFLPHILKLEELLKKDTIGKVKLLQLNFGFEKGKNLDRLFKLEYGGGALLDMGIYGISLAVKLYGYPVDIKFDIAGSRAYKGIVSEHC